MAPGCSQRRRRPPSPPGHGRLLLRRTTCDLARVECVSWVDLPPPARHLPCAAPDFSRVGRPDRRCGTAIERTTAPHAHRSTCPNGIGVPQLVNAGGWCRQAYRRCLHRSEIPVAVVVGRFDPDEGGPQCPQLPPRSSGTSRYSARSSSPRCSGSWPATVGSPVTPTRRSPPVHRLVLATRPPPVRGPPCGHRVLHPPPRRRRPRSRHVARRLCTIVGFYRYSEEEGVIEQLPGRPHPPAPDRLRVPRRPPRPQRARRDAGDCRAGLGPRPRVGFVAGLERASSV